MRRRFILIGCDNVDGSRLTCAVCDDRRGTGLFHLLGSKEPIVSPLDELGSVDVWTHSADSAKAHGNVKDGAVVEGDRRVAGGLFRDLADSSDDERGSPWKDHDELLTAVACDDIRRTTGDFDHLGNVADDRVSGRMTVGIVHLLEVVDVGHDEAEGEHPPVGSFDEAGVVLLEPPSTSHLGESVTRGQIVETLVFTFETLDLFPKTENGKGEDDGETERDNNAHDPGDCELRVQNAPLSAGIPRNSGGEKTIGKRVFCQHSFLLFQTILGTLPSVIFRNVMANYNHRKYLERQKQKNQTRSGGTMSSRKKAWLGFSLIVLLFLIALGFALPQTWKAIGLPGLSQDGFRLGLDLQGGTHLVYEADMSQIPAVERGEALSGVRDVIERRVNAFGVSEPVVQTIQSGATHRIVVELAGVLDVSEAINQIGETPILEFKEPGSDSGALSEEQRTELDTKQSADRAVASDALIEAKRTGAFPEGVNAEALPVASPTHPLYGSLVSKIVNDRIRQGGFFTEENGEGINLVRYDSQKTDEQWLVSQIWICFQGKPGCGVDALPQIEATLRAEQALDGLTAENFAERVTEYSTDLGSAGNGGDLSWIQPGVFPPALELAIRELSVGGVSTTVAESDFGYHIFLKREQQPIKTYQLTRALYPLTSASDIAPSTAGWVNTALSGKQLKHAAVEFAQQGASEPYISITFDSEGDKLFGELTARLLKRPIGIFLDGELISAPIVQQAIYGGQAQITGNFTVDEAKVLAQRLNAGALPVPIDLLSQQTVGPTLGQNSLTRSLNAGAVGFLLVGLFMLLYYRLPGLLSILALALYGVLNLATYKIFGVTMTLAGIAGFILSVGMAVDANVLIFERLKEELRSGRDLPRAIEQGFNRAWTSIRDGNITTLIATAILFFFGASFIKGFAVTLTIGVLLSMFSAIVVTRTFLRVVSLSKRFNSSWLYGVSHARKDV